MKASWLLSLAALGAFATSGFSQDQPQESIPPKLQKVADSLKWQDEGTVPLGSGGLASLALQNGYRFLDSKDTNRVMTEIWGNLPSKSFGMIFPKGLGPLDASAWAVEIVGFEEEGYVKDADADKIDAPALLKQIQDGQKEDNEARKQQGLSELEIVGWASPPRYDKEAKKLFWALDITSKDGRAHYVNYFIRILGRKGYLVLNAIGDLDATRDIESATPQILSMIEFNEGHRYADFKPGTDKVATYGIAGLIVGGLGLKVAAKLGVLALFAKKFGFILIAFKKFWIVAVAGVAALSKKIKGWFGGKSQGQG